MGYVRSVKGKRKPGVEKEGEKVLSDIFKRAEEKLHSGELRRLIADIVKEFPITAKVEMEKKGLLPYLKRAQSLAELLVKRPSALPKALEGWVKGKA